MRSESLLLLFKRKCIVQQVLKAGTWSSQTNFSTFYLRDVLHKYMYIGPVEAAQMIM